MATTIHNNCHGDGHPPAASMAPQSANGSAKTECSHLIISSETRMLWRVDIDIYCSCGPWLIVIPNEVRNPCGTSRLLALPSRGQHASRRQGFLAGKLRPLRND